MRIRFWFCAARGRWAGPGMPEWGQLPIPKKLLRAGTRDMVRISDARMSGTSYGACVLHVAPESAVGGPLGLVEDGDMIELDIENGRLDLRVSEEEMGAAAGDCAAKPARGGLSERLRVAISAACDAGERGLRFRFRLPPPGRDARAGYFLAAAKYRHNSAMAKKSGEADLRVVDRIWRRWWGGLDFESARRQRHGRGRVAGFGESQIRLRPASRKTAHRQRRATEKRGRGESR